MYMRFNQMGWPLTIFLNGSWSQSIMNKLHCTIKGKCCGIWCSLQCNEFPSKSLLLVFNLILTHWSEFHSFMAFNADQSHAMNAKKHLFVEKAILDLLLKLHIDRFGSHFPVFLSSAQFSRVLPFFLWLLCWVGTSGWGIRHSRTRIGDL